MKCRHIIIQDTNGKQYDSLWCDCSDCDECVLRYECYTSTGNLIITFPAEDIINKVGTLREKRWRLRDGSSEKREFKKGRPAFPRHESVRQMPV